MGIRVFKFGGASVKDAAGVRNVASILNSFKDEHIVVVVSAMGKTTNAFENIVNAYFSDPSKAKQDLQSLKDFHFLVMKDLFDDNESVYVEINNFFAECEWVLEEEQRNDYDLVYDQLVAFGELIATRIVSAFLTKSNIQNGWADARDFICTDDTFREAKIKWEQTESKASSFLLPVLDKNKIVVTQGFIGCTTENLTTTLGREGSDYTASILAYCLNATEVVIWKDVPGVLNADPKYFKNTKMLDKVSYLDAIELAYYGAGVIHPKTIQPIQNKNIPLHVKSFLSPQSPGTLISKESQSKPLVPNYIFKDKQVLLSLSAKDFSFIAEEHLRDIFQILSELKIKINLMQNSAISFSISIDDPKERMKHLLDNLSHSYQVLYNENLMLFTIRHYDEEAYKHLSEGKEILLEQRSRNTLQFLARQKS